MKYLCVVAVQESLSDLAQDDAKAPIQEGQDVAARLRLVRRGRDLLVWDPDGGANPVGQLYERLKEQPLLAFILASEFSLPLVLNLQGGTLTVEPARSEAGTLPWAWPGHVCQLRWSPEVPPPGGAVKDVSEEDKLRRAEREVELILDPLVFTVDDEQQQQAARLKLLLNSSNLLDLALVLPPTPVPDTPKDQLALYDAWAVGLRDDLLNGPLGQLTPDCRPAAVLALELARDPFIRDFLAEKAGLWFTDAGPNGRAFRLTVPALPADEHVANDYRLRFLNDPVPDGWRRDLQKRLRATVDARQCTKQLQVCAGGPRFPATTGLDRSLFGEEQWFAQEARNIQMALDMRRANQRALADRLRLLRQRALDIWAERSPTTLDLVRQALGLAGGPLPESWGDLGLQMARTKEVRSGDDRPAAALAVFLFAPLLSGHLAGDRLHLGGPRTLDGFFQSLARLAARGPAVALRDLLDQYFRTSNCVDPNMVEWCLLGPDAEGGRALLLPPHTGWPQVLVLAHLLCPLQVAVRPAASLWDGDEPEWTGRDIPALFGCEEVLAASPDAIGFLAAP
jgi:hypothetical protein